jgi:hypothetical protein
MTAVQHGMAAAETASSAAAGVADDELSRRRTADGS